MITKRRLGLAAALTAMLGCATACGQFLAMPSAQAADKPTIGVSVADQKSLFYIAAVDGMRDAAQKVVGLAK